MSTDPALAAQRLALALIVLCCAPTWRAELSPTPSPPPLPPATLCAHVDRGVLIAAACDAPGAAVLTARARRALALRPCWRTASAARFADLRGVGAASGRAVARFRNAGGMPDVAALRAWPGIGARAAEAVAAGVDAQCVSLPH